MITKHAVAALLASGLTVLRMGRPAEDRARRPHHRSPVATTTVDASNVAQALGRAIKHQTISRTRQAPTEAAAFEALRLELEASFPRTHASLERVRIADHSLLYSWPGTQPELEPVVLVAHLDVVPVDPGSEHEWSHPPFSGLVTDGYVWGRGALDDKGSLVAILTAVEDLLADGFVPRRTLLMAFGHDEEIGGDAGARAIADELSEQGVHAALVLDEGGAISDAPIPGVGPVALVGIAEKGLVSLELTVETAGGHSSMPPRQSAVGILAHALDALERHRPRARLVEATRATLEAFAPRLPASRRLLLSHLDLFEPLVLRALARHDTTDAAIRTTTAATVIHAGAKPSVLPTRARATVNFRILPGETVDDVVAHARATVADERVRFEIASDSVARDPSATSPASGPAFELLAATIKARFPEVVVAPYLVLGGTDARHYEAIADHVYRFVPLRIGAATRDLLHGTDERVAIDELAGAVAFYTELIRRAQSEH